ncbi:hypothetical protein P3X46_027981 [Hevea brasiliensis]|uniref:Uncharacterized protein n=1 Tax=Hevea brasiliensis TaxID=3981 RepID=A0ABQ9KMK0_HEVBR|nr:hypothetical protein P3X46_027981 [Hevea brasiliensis]
MTKIKLEEELLELDPEIDKTLRAIKRGKRHQKPEPAVFETPTMDTNIKPRPLRDYGTPTIQGFQSNVTRPTVEANNFELKPMNGVSDEAIRLKASHSLSEIR